MIGSVSSIGHAEDGRQSSRTVEAVEAPSGRQLRILFVAHTAERGGPSYSLLTLLQVLHRRHSVAVLLPEEGFLSQGLAEMGVETLLMPRIGVASIPAVTRLIRLGDFDAVYGNNPGSCSRNALIAARLARRPFIWHFRAVKTHWGLSRGWMIGRADRVIAVSEACARPLRRFCRAGKISVVYNGVDLGASPGEDDGAREWLRRSLGLPHDAPVVISVSHLIPLKGIGVALDAFSRIVSQGLSAYLLLAGGHDRNPDYAAGIVRRIEQEGLGHAVRVLGFRNDASRLMRGSDIFLHTSNRDAHPRAVIEAMAAGLPVVAFSVDGVAETVVDGVTGRLVPLGDTLKLELALKQLLEDNVEARRMGRAGRGRVEQLFTATRCAVRIEEVIQEIVLRHDARRKRTTLIESKA